jgi:hypothetical protein
MLEFIQKRSVVLDECRFLFQRKRRRAAVHRAAGQGLVRIRRRGKREPSSEREYIRLSWPSSAVRFLHPSLTSDTTNYDVDVDATAETSQH